jgi:hypothetical protein
MKNTIVMILIFASCSKHKNDYYFEPSVVKKIIALTKVVPPPAVIGIIKIYIIDKDSVVSESNFMELKMIYDTFYKNKHNEFHNFLFLTLNQKISIPSTYKSIFTPYQTFIIDSKIKKLYENNGIDIILKKYCSQNNNSFLLNKGALKLNEINSISYYLFINQYLRIDDDYNATINFRKLNLLLN